VTWADLTRPRATRELAAWPSSGAAAAAIHAGLRFRLTRRRPTELPPALGGGGGHGRAILFEDVRNQLKGRRAGNERLFLTLATAIRRRVPPPPLVRLA
jgi:hypothetical protein